VGTGTNQVNESYSYNAHTGLLDSQTATRNGSTPLNLSYDYTNSSGKRTGQLVKISNNLDHSKDRGYSYDALGRLVQATAGPSASTLWTQSYTYDRYGNRTSVSASGYSASLRDRRVTDPLAVATGPVSEPGAVATGSSALPSSQRATPPAHLLARNSVRERSEGLSDSPPTLRRPVSPQGGPVFTDDPLTAGVTIKAVHVTELRTAINQARARGPGSSIVG
jgi:hypothetical protein